MKTNGNKKSLTFGDLVAASYRAWGARRAKGLVRLAVNAHLVVFRGQQRFVIPEEQDENLSLERNAD
jgi:hypothetical protein